MISLETIGGGTPRVLGVFSFRFDAHLVPALKANTAPLVDGWLSWDDTRAQGPFSDELTRRHALLTAARETGAQWALVLDPDERLARRAARLWPRLLASEASLVTFPLREMYSPSSYRVDGAWGTKRQGRLLSLRDEVVRPDVAPGSLHVPWAVFLPEVRALDTDLNVYHLKMIDQRRREARARLYEALDPEHRMQAIGYSYLADDTGLQLQRIRRRNRYEPVHVDDGGLWMAAEHDLGESTS